MNLPKGPSVATATEHKNCTSRSPWGERLEYDFVDRCDVAGEHKGNPFDYVAVCVVMEDVCIIPEGVVHRQRSVALYPHLEKSKYAKYMEAWGLLKGRKLD